MLLNGLKRFPDMIYLLFNSLFSTCTPHPAQRFFVFSLIHPTQNKSVTLPPVEQKSSLLGPCQLKINTPLTFWVGKDLTVIISVALGFFCPFFLRWVAQVISECWTVPFGKNNSFSTGNFGARTLDLLLSENSILGLLHLWGLQTVLMKSETFFFDFSLTYG